MHAYWRAALIWGPAFIWENTVCIAYKRFAVQTHLWSLELWSITTLEHDAITHFGTSSRKLHKNRFQSFLSLSNFSSFFIFPNIFCRRLQILFHCILQAAPPLDPTLTNTVGLGLHIPWKRLPFMVFSGYFTKYFRKGVFHTTPSGFYLFKATMVTPGQCVKSVQS